MKAYDSPVMGKTSKRLFSFLLIMAILICPFQSSLKRADSDIVTFITQPGNKTYDSETDEVGVNWSVEVDPHYRVRNSQIYSVHKDGSRSFLTTLENEWSTNKFGYNFRVSAPENYIYVVYVYYSLNQPDAQIINHVESELFTISYVDNRFIMQPQSAPYNASTGKLDVNWKTNFVPTKVELYSDRILQETLSQTGMNGSYSFDALCKRNYSIRAYWDDSFYTESENFRVNESLEFTKQPENMQYYMDNKKVSVSWETNFNPYKVEIKRYSNDEVIYSSTYNRNSSFLMCSFIPAIGSHYYVRAYMNEKSYVDSNYFWAENPNGIRFLVQPQDGQYKASTMDYETNFQLTFPASSIHLMYYDGDDKEYVETSDFILLPYVQNNYTIVVPYDYKDCKLKIVADYLAEDDNGDAVFRSVESREFVARETAASFVQQPVSDYNQPFVYPGIDYTLSWKTDFKPVRIKIVHNYRWTEDGYDWDTDVNVTSDLKNEMTFTDFTPEIGVEYKVLAYYTDDEYVASDTITEDFPNLRVTLDLSGRYTLHPLDYTYIWSQSFVPYKVTLAYNYANRHEWDALWSYSEIYQYNELHISDSDYFPQKGVGYRLLIYYGEGEYDFIVSDPFVENYDNLKFETPPHSGYLSDQNGKMCFIQTVSLNFLPQKWEVYLEGEYYMGREDPDLSYYGIGVNDPGIYEFRAYFTDDQYISEFFEVFEEVPFYAQPQSCLMDYEQIDFTTYVWHVADVDFGFPMSEGDLYDVERLNENDQFVTYSPNNSDPGDYHTLQIHDEGIYRIVIKHKQTVDGHVMYFSFISDGFTVSKDTRFTLQPTDEVCHVGAEIPGKVIWKTAFYPDKVVFQHLQDGTFVDFRTFDTDMEIFNLSFDLSAPEKMFNEFSLDIYTPGTYRILAFYGEGAADYISSDTFHVEQFKFTSQPEDKYPRTGYEGKIRYNDTMTLGWETNAKNFANRVVLFRRPAGADENMPWDQFDITGKNEVFSEATHDIKGTNKWESYDYFIRVWLNEDEKSFIDSDVFNIEMMGRWEGMRLFSEGYCFDRGSGEIAVPIVINDNPGFTSGDFIVKWNPSLFDLVRVEYNNEVFPVRDVEPLRTLWGYYIIHLGDPDAQMNNAETGPVFTLYFERYFDERDEEGFYDVEHDDEFWDQFWENRERKYYGDLTEEEYWEGYNEEYDNYAQYDLNYYPDSDNEFDSASPIIIEPLSLVNSAGEDVTYWGFEFNEYPAIIYKDSDYFTVAYKNTYVYSDRGEVQVPVYAVRNPGFQTASLDFSLPAGRWSDLKLKDIEFNSDFAPLITYSIDYITDEYTDDVYGANLEVVFGDEEATEDFTNTGVMFTLIYDITECITNGYSPVYLDGATINNVEGDDVSYTQWNTGDIFVSDFRFDVQPGPCDTEDFEEVYDGECRIKWYMSTEAKKLILYRRPSGADETTSWEPLEIRGYLCESVGPGIAAYTYTIEGLYGDSTYDYFIRAVDPSERYYDSDIKAAYTGEEYYIDSEIFTIHINGKVVYTLVEAADPTFEEDGNIEYYKGSDGKYYLFSGEEYVETTLEEVILPKKEYTMVEIDEKDINGYITPLSVRVEDFSERDFEVPASPYLDGYDFAGWKVNGTLYSTSEEVQAAVAELVAEAPSEPILVEVDYEQKEETYHVTVTGGTFEDGTREGDFQSATELAAKADPAEEGKQFDHWELNGEVASYNATYYFHVASHDMTLEAVYSDVEAEVEKKGTAFIESVTLVSEGKLAFVSKVSIPEGARILRAGIVASNEADLGENELTADTAKYVRYNDTTCYDYLSFKYTWTKKEIGEDDVWCARSYLVYRDEAGEEHTVYGELVRANLSGIINE